MNKLKHNTTILFAGFAALLGTATITGCGSSEGKTEAKKETTEAVAPALETISLSKDKLSSIFTSPAELIAYQQVDIYAKEAAFVKKMNVDVGTEVSAGQLLTQLEAPELTSRIAAAESRLKSQEAIYLASKANYDRLYKTSLTPGTVSPNDLDQALARMKADEAQLEAAKAANKEVTIIRDYLEIRAPFSGVISARNVNTGAYVGPSGKGSELPLFTLQEQKHLRLVISVPELYTSYLSHKNEVEFSVKSLANQTFKGSVKRLSGALDTRLRAERIEVDVINDNKKLLPGMIAEVHIPMPAQDSSLVVPKSTVLNSTTGVFVIRVNNNKAEWVTVQKGREADGKVEIFGKLTPGDNLIANATEEVRDGSTIKTTPKKN
ncbi:RND family efflux transporter, MFP subunit [Filimonas lacunae]|uniref:RND family efflux transporter, MFP subunit n=1 Tax=Filimonas lacunae TaxID=477680 RepID=A0A173MK20_9BACT|nr:efflux RND transporter periplasmic adaptor subunit [Filimonas lacunae]BAV07819.1 Co/Zn/Cd efflux system membrane fusion protein [Filimonas lacunae]SIT05195.1 RND family efflux transporter, MFP subunit [Filimonas lacunae]